MNTNIDTNKSFLAEMGREKTEEIFNRLLKVYFMTDDLSGVIPAFSIVTFDGKSIRLERKNYFHPELRPTITIAEMTDFDLEVQKSGHFSKKTMQNLQHRLIANEVGATRYVAALTKFRKEQNMTSYFNSVQSAKTILDTRNNDVDIDASYLLSVSTEGEEMPKSELNSLLDYIRQATKQDIPESAVCPDNDRLEASLIRGLED